MADATDSKSVARKGVWVQVPPPVLLNAGKTRGADVTRRPDRPTRGGEQAWRPLAILAGLLTVEACLVGWCFGSWLLAVPGKRLLAIGLVGMLGGLWSHIERHKAEYRMARVSWPLVTGQVLSFAGVFAAVGWLAAGAPTTLLGDTGTPLAATVAAVAWLACSLASIAPTVELARTLLGSAGVCAAMAVTSWHMGDLTQSFWNQTGETTVRLVELLLTPLAGGPVIRPEPFVLGTDAFQVRILAACSGFHGIGLITMLLAGYLWWFRKLHRFPQSLLLLPIGVALVWLANVVRITALILVGIWISPAIAVDGFHSTAGWLAFLTVGLGIIWAATRMPFFTRSEPVAAEITAAESSPSAVRPQAIPEADGERSPAAFSVAACLIPFLALTAITMLTRAFTSGFDLLYPVRVVCVAGVLWSLRDALPWRECRISLLPVAIGGVAFAVWMLLAPWATAPSFAMPPGLHADPLDPAQLGQPWTTLWLLFRVAGSSVTVPIAEELFFRGFVTRRCISEDADSVPLGQFSWFSFLVSAVSFGVLHGNAWLAGIVVGMLFGVALYARRRLFDAVVAHATTNALLSCYVMATGSWSEWG
jgi:exosortase E/protease (VPEID-CTERM system)